MGKLRASKPHHAGADVSLFTNSPLSKISNKYMYLPNLCVGNFSPELSAYICTICQDDFWLLDLMVSDHDPKHLYPCLESCLIYYESIGIKQFYYAFPSKWARAYQSFWKQGVPSLKKYTIEDIELVKANKKTNTDFIWKNVMNCYVSPVSLLIRKSYF